ncbi:MFS transporter [Streptomyces sp. L7]|uniref:MFS transporter n=1 Tax=Streptomyces sp. L7 TaxID=3423954 RepID=UPI003D971BDF
MTGTTAAASQATIRRIIAPLALAQFICSFAGSNMNVMINDMSRDLGTTVQGIQVSITLFLLTMAALMIPMGKLTDNLGRKRSFVIGLIVYGVGALVTAAAPGLWAVILGNSLLEGVGTAMLIPPVYILTTICLPDIPTRAVAFGIISGMGGVGAAAGPLIGGLITTAISWRAAFLFQALVIVVILLLSRSLTDPLPADPKRPFDTVGAILSALGLFVLVMGILAADTSVPLMIALVIAGVAILIGFLLWVRRRERTGRAPLLSTSLFRVRVSNLALITQNLQWVILMGTSFTVSAYLQVVRGYNAIQTGVIFTAATIGLLLTSLLAGRLARRFSQRGLIVTGFVLCVPGVVLLIWLVAGTTGGWPFVPGLFLIGAGLGLMLTPSVNVVQSAFPERVQGEISGLSRSVSNLGSTFGTAIAGTILVANLQRGGEAYGIAMAVVAVLGATGLIAALLLPRTAAAPAGAPTAGRTG